MTCIVGIVENGMVTIGGDSLGSAGTDGQVRKDKKVFRQGNFIMGFTTSYRMGQLLQYKFAATRDLYFQEDPMSYMVNVFVEDVRRCLKDGGYAMKKEEGEYAGTFLVGFAGHLYKIDSDYQVAESMDDFDACGCGEAYAVGNLYSSVHLSAHDRILQALGAAEHFSTGVKGPFTMITL